MRKHWIDNLRWMTVLLVLLYHVFYFYNNKGVFGGIGGFGDGPQYQDVVMYILYPWFMPMLFILAGISARYALQKHPAREWFKARFDSTGRFAAYMTRSSFGIYIVHYLVIAGLGYMMKTCTQLPPWSMYVILTVAVSLSPLLYEGLRRIPVVKWCVFGE